MGTIVPATVEKTEEAVVEKSAEPVKKVLSYPLHYPYGRLHYSTGYPAYTYGGYGYPYHTGYAGYRYGGYPYHTVKYVVKPAEAEAKSDEAVEEVKKVVPFSSYYYPHHFGYNYGRYYY